MARQVIGGRDGLANFSIDAVEYECILTEHEFETTTDQVESTTFCTETAPEFEEGETRHVFRIAGLLVKGIAGAGPLLPLPQGAAIVQTFSTGCTLTYDGNFTRGLARRTVKQNGIIAGEGLVTGPVVKAWVVA